MTAHRLCGAPREWAPRRQCVLATPSTPECKGRLRMLTDSKVLALIAHDGKKADMVAFATFNREKLADYHLIATSTTGRLLSEKVGLEVEKCLSGPLGGDV